jgi:predicted porin
VQKKLVVLVFGGLVSAQVFAQSNVTLYGIIDAAVSAGSAGGNDFRGVTTAVWNGNRFGFKGSEDLGNGLKAVYQLEQGFNVDDGSPNSTRQFHRQSWLGLAGGFGTVGIGRQYAPGYFAIHDAALAGTLSPQQVLATGNGLTLVSSSQARWDNSLAYTGSFSGLTFRANYSMNSTEASRDPQNDDKWGVGAEYANSQLKASVIYHYLKEDSDDQKEWYVGAEYDFGLMKLAGSLQNAFDVGALDQSKRLWNFGVIVPTSAVGTLHVSYGVLKERDLDNSDAKSWMFAYRHALSKRTTAYVAYNRTTNDDSVQYGMVRAPANVTGKASALSMLGIVHTF